jgi:hypothetical protein
MSLPMWARVGKARLAEHSPTILSGLAVGGLVATVALAIRATSKAAIAIDEARDNKEYKTADTEERAALAGDRRVALTRQEIVQETWKLFIPSAVAASATIACIIGSNQVGLRQKAALAGAYSLAEVAFREYKDEVIKVLGEKKEQGIGEKITERKIQEKTPDAQVIIVGGDDQLCYDELTVRYFRSTAEKIRHAEIDLKTCILKDMWVDHNYFYSLLDLEGVLIGEALGWNLDHMPDIIFSSHLSPTGQPCLAVRFKNLPKVDYLNYH